MQDLLNLIMGSSTTLDVYVIVRLIVVITALELFTICCALIGGMKRQNAAFIGSEPTERSIVTFSWNVVTR